MKIYLKIRDVSCILKENYRVWRVDFDNVKLDRNLTEDNLNA